VYTLRHENMYVLTLLTLDMVIDLVDHVPDVYLSLYSELTAEHVIYMQRQVILLAR
jgi:hypothetical protein